MTKPISPRRAKTREKLLEAGFRVLAREGLAGASIEEITEEAGFTRGAFYSNFASKEELFGAVIDNEMQKRLTAISAAAEDLRKLPLSAPIDPNVLSQFMRRIIVDPESEREWQIILTEFELFSLRNPDASRSLPQPDRTYLDDIAAVMLPVMKQWGIKFAADPLVSIRLLINGYLGAAKELLRTNPDGLAGGMPAEVEWFTVLVGRFLQLEALEPES